MDLLLVNPTNKRSGYVSEHLGLAGLQAWVTSNGFEADTLDMAIERYTPEQVIYFILRVNPKIVGFSLLNGNSESGLALIEKVRLAGYGGKIVVGGYFATFCAREILSDFPGIDFVVRGEGELTLLELMKALIEKRVDSFRPILGLTYREGCDIIENPPRPLIEDLDILPPPDRKYAPKVLEKYSHLRLSASRGCWGQCTFCEIIGFYGISPGKAWRSRSVRHLVDEIEQLIKTYQTNYFVFNDDQFLLKGDSGLTRVENFARELEKRNLNIKFELMARADTVSKERMTRFLLKIFKLFVK